MNPDDLDDPALDHNLASQAFGRISPEDTKTAHNLSQHQDAFSLPPKTPPPQPEIRPTHRKMQQIWIRLPTTIHRTLKHYKLQLERDGTNVSMQDIINTALTTYLETRPTLPPHTPPHDHTDEITKRIERNTRLQLKEILLEEEDNPQHPTTLMDFTGHILTWWTTHTKLTGTNPGQTPP